MANPEIFTNNVQASETSTKENEDGSYTFIAKMEPFPINWHFSSTDYSGTATVTVQIDLPDGTAFPAFGVFRPTPNGGYEIAVWGADWYLPESLECPE